MGAVTSFRDEIRSIFSFVARVAFHHWMAFFLGKDSSEFIVVRPDLRAS